MNLAEYVSARGAVQTLADKMNVRHSTISRWATGDRIIPVERLMDLERATGGKVTRGEARPDLADLFECPCPRKNNHRKRAS